MGATLWKRVKKQGLWAGSLCSNERMKWPLVPLGECNWLVCVILWAGGELKPATQGWAGTVPSSRDKEDSLAKEPYSCKHNKEENLWLGHLRPSGFSPDVKAYMLLGLNFRSYATILQKWFCSLLCASCQGYVMSLGCITDDIQLDLLIKMVAIMLLHCNGTIFPLVSDKYHVGSTLRPWKYRVSPQTFARYFYNPLPNGDFLFSSFLLHLFIGVLLKSCPFSLIHLFIDFQVIYKNYFIKCISNYLYQYWLMNNYVLLWVIIKLYHYWFCALNRSIFGHWDFLSVGSVFFWRDPTLFFCIFLSLL